MSTLTDRYYHETTPIDVCKDDREFMHAFQADMVDAIIDHRIDGLCCELALINFALDACEAEKQLNYRKRAAQRVRLSRVPLTLADGLETPMEWYRREIKPFTYQELHK